MNFKLILTLIIIFHSSQLNTKILIFTHAFNRPDFIIIQKKTFDKFIAEEYEFMVFNDANNDDMANNINNTCSSLNITCVRIPQEIHNLPYLERWPGEDFNHPAVRPANAIQFSLNEYGFKHDDYLLIIDSDCFLIKPFSIRKYMENCDLAGVEQSRGISEKSIEYLWNGLVFMDCQRMPNKESINFNSGQVEGIPVDIGGHIYYYIKQNPNARIKYIDCVHSNNFLCENCHKQSKSSCTHNTALLKSIGMDTKTIKLIQSKISNFEFLLKNNFLHYRGGGNWNNMSNFYHAQKTMLLNRYINSILI